MWASKHIESHKQTNELNFIVFGWYFKSSALVVIILVDIKIDLSYYILTILAAIYSLIIIYYKYPAIHAN